RRALLVPLACAAFGGAASAQLPTTRVDVDSSGAQTKLDSYEPALSADGRWVAFASLDTTLVAGDTNQSSDVFVHDRVTGVTVRVSISSSAAEGNGSSYYPALSKDGRFVAFESVATNLVPFDGNGKSDVFVHDRDPDRNGIYDEGNGKTTRVSVSSPGVGGDGGSYFPAISANGRDVAFHSEADDLVAGDTNGGLDVFVRDRIAGTTVRVSVDSAGAEANGYSHFPSISADGSVVAFTSYASNLVGGDGNGEEDVFVHDLVTGVTACASVDATGATG